MKYLIIYNDEEETIRPITIPNEDFLNGFNEALIEFDAYLNHYDRFLWPDQASEIYTLIERLPVDKYHTQVLKELKQLGIIE